MTARTAIFTGSSATNTATSSATGPATNIATNTATSSATKSTRFWAYCAAFGALWGAVEVTVGTLLHTLRIPLSGVLLATVAAALLIAQRQLLPLRGLTLATGVVAALCKTLSPGGIILHPMAAILVEATLVELALLAFPRSPISAVVASTLAVGWAVSQKLITQIVLYGGDVVELFLETLRRAGEILGPSRPPVGAGLLIALASGLLSLGLIGGLVGHRIGVLAAARMDARRPSADVPEQDGLPGEAGP